MLFSGDGVLDSELWLHRFLEWMRLRNWSAQTQANYGAGVREFLRFLDSQGVRQVNAITRALIESFRVHLFQKRYRGKPLTMSTQASRLTAVKSFVRYLADADYLLLDVGAAVKLPRYHRPLPRVLSEDEAVRLVEAPDVTQATGVRDRAILETFYCSGVRSHELGQLTLADVDWQEQSLWIRHGKGDKSRLVPLGDEAVAWMEEYLARVRPLWLASADEDHLFLTRRGTPMDRSTLGTVVTRWARSQGLQASPHTLRHSCATHMLRRGANLRHLQALLGHESPLSTQHYTKVEISDLHKAVRRFHPRERKWGQ